RNALADYINADELELLDDELAFQHAHQYSQLPTGTIHADLFRDNVLFEGDRVSGVIDFYYACHGILLFDLAVVCNDWCIDESGQLLHDRWRELSTAYAIQRPFT